MRGLGRGLQELWQLAWPLALVQFNNNLTGAVDTALAGRVDQLTLGATGLGASVYVAASVLGMSPGLGADPLAAQALGADDGPRARMVLRQGIFLALAVALPLMLLTSVLADRLELLGVDVDVAAGARSYLLGRLPGLPAYCIVGVLRSYLQAARLTRPVLLSALAMNAFNVVADWLLLFGDDGLRMLGLPPVGLCPQGTFGLGLASALASWVQLGVLVVAVRAVVAQRRGAHRPGATSWATADADADPDASTRPDGALLWRMLGLGLPAALQMLAEVGIFSLMSVLVGGMGATVAAAHQAAMMLAGLSFSLCVGVAAATAVHVGRAIGRGDARATQVGGVAGLVLGQGIMLAAALAMWLAPETLARLMTQDPEVLQIAAPLVFIAGFFQLVDGAQVVAAGALRGAGQTTFAFVANVVAHWGIGLPVGWYLAYQVGLGPAGLWWGITAGLSCVAVALCGRFFWASRRGILAMRA